MCDYSLHGVPSRPARVGDALVTTRFRHSATHGFAALEDRDTAVCLPPGTELAFEREAEYRHPFSRLWPNLRFGKLADKVARFRHVNTRDPDAHHDALEFADGRIVLLTRLCEGQRATVLQLPACKPARSEPGEPRRRSLA